MDCIAYNSLHLWIWSSQLPYIYRIIMRMKRINTISTNDHVKLTGKLEKKELHFVYSFVFPGLINTGVNILFGMEKYHNMLK